MPTSFTSAVRRPACPSDALEARGLSRIETTLPSYSVDLDRLEESGGELYPVLSANRASSCGAPFGILNSSARCVWARPATVAEALIFFNSMKALHCASWERRGEPHAF